ncbi:DUF4249 domain-containing protein [Rufibacter sp. LB8]|uniref:DUF4249 domain-containing protein n=1 Tax=Rufibacter sp. LB8 TaxID=2777781 RepID=UPI00178C61FA|nr:DUF4249 domain-containing protein [Rufibacter sp. LB8]
MKSSFKFLWLGLFCLVLASCVEEYLLPETAAGEGLLVVDGAVEIEARKASVRLTRTQSLANKAAAKPETGATVWLEYGNGTKITLAEKPAGTYSATGLAVDYGVEYKLRIKTKNNREYTSTAVSTGKTPPIESITWDVEGSNVNIRVNTSDPANSTKYYRWTYDETFEYTAPYYTRRILDKDGKMRLRTPEDSTYQNCWKYGASTNILVGATTRLANDVVNGFRIAAINGNSEKLSMRYSILVKQYAISREEHDFWEILRKNTEEVGSLFDAQPSQIRGNVTNIRDVNEPVLGYFSARSLATKRFFLERAQLNPWEFQYTRTCTFVPVPIIPGVGPDPNFINDFVKMRYVLVDPLDEIDFPPPSPSADGDSGPPWMLKFSCAECRDNGGSGKKPDFW